MLAAALAAAPAAVAGSSDEALVALRDAAARRDAAAYDAIAGQIDPAGPLADYVPFWRLQMRLAEAAEAAEAAGPAADPARLDADVQAFVDAHPDSVLADRLLGPWLLSLGRRSLWRLFDTYWPKWDERSDDDVWCLAGLSRLARGQAPEAATMRVWGERRELGDDCSTLTLRLFEAGRLDSASLGRRLRGALEDKATGTIRTIGRLDGIAPDALDQAVDSPARALAFSDDPRVTLIALGLLARPSPEIAAARLAERRDLTEADRRLLWAIIGASATRDLVPEAWTWARQGLDAEVSTGTREWLVRAALLAGDWPGVLAAIDRLDARTRERPRWTYWRARALAETGQADAARALLTLTAGVDDFYRLLAADEIGETLHMPTGVAAGDDPVRPDALRARAPIARALALFRLGLRHDATREWQYATRSMNDDELLAAARLACDEGVLDRCVVTATRTRARHDWSLRFPTPFRERLVPAATSHDLDPAWVYGLIRQESRFAIDARSGVGAKGLMQIMPATGRWIARKRGISGFRTAHLEELGTNLDFGTWYLRHVLEDVGESLPLAAAGYNAGPRRPAQWRTRMPRTVDGALFVELIPFNETRRYVQNVMANTVMYSLRLDESPVSLRHLLGRVDPGADARPQEPAAPPAPEAPLM